VVASALVGAPAGTSANEDTAVPAITVRPSGTLDEGEEARRRQEALLRRMEQSEYDFRSICRLCGSPERFDGPQPFEPYRSLGISAPRE
jgi:hypothetical protein